MEGVDNLEQENNSTELNEQEIVDLSIFFGIFKGKGKPETVERMYNRFLQSWLVKTSIVAFMSVAGYRIGGFSLTQIWEWLQSLINSG